MPRERHGACPQGRLQAREGVSEDLCVLVTSLLGICGGIREEPDSGLAHSRAQLLELLDAPGKLLPGLPPELHHRQRERALQLASRMREPAEIEVEPCAQGQLLTEQRSAPGREQARQALLRAQDRCAPSTSPPGGMGKLEPARLQPASLRNLLAGPEAGPQGDRLRRGDLVDVGVGGRDSMRRQQAVERKEGGVCLLLDLDAGEP